MLMAKLLQELKRHGKIHFELVFLVMNPGYNADNWKIIRIMQSFWEFLLRFLKVIFLIQWQKLRIIPVTCVRE
mgnify:FL=1